MHCISTQNLACVALYIQKLRRGSQILNLGHVTLTTPPLGVICHPMANTCCLNMSTKYEVSSLNSSNDIEGYFIDKICIVHARYHVVKSNPLFGFLTPIFPIQYAASTDLPLTKI